MRLQNKNFLLKAEFKHTNPNTQIGVYDGDLNLLATSKSTSIELNITLPNKVIFHLTDVDRSGVYQISLAGIVFSNESLKKILEFQELVSIEELEHGPSVHKIFTNKDGCFVLNLFNANPFALHLFVGNKIKI